MKIKRQKAGATVLRPPPEPEPDCEYCRDQGHATRAAAQRYAAGGWVEECDGCERFVVAKRGMPGDFR